VRHHDHRGAAGSEGFRSGLEPPIAVRPATPKGLLLRNYTTVIGGAEGIRTPDLCIANAALYQLSYGPSLAIVLAPVSWSWAHCGGAGTFEPSYLVSLLAALFQSVLQPLLDDRSGEVTPGSLDD
jgi:hypothetical protein